MGLLDSLYDFQTGVYTVTRNTNASPTYDANGRTQAQTTTTFVVNGCAQPLTGRDISITPDAEHASEIKWFYTDTELRTHYPGQSPDVITIVNEKGTAESWVVKTVERWDYLDEVFWRCKIARRSVV